MAKSKVRVDSIVATIELDRKNGKPKIQFDRELVEKKTDQLKQIENICSTMINLHFMGLLKVDDEIYLYDNYLCKRYDFGFQFSVSNYQENVLSESQIQSTIDSCLEQLLKFRG